MVFFMTFLLTGISMIAPDRHKYTPLLRWNCDAQIGDRLAFIDQNLMSGLGGYVHDISCRHVMPFPAIDGGTSHFTAATGRSRSHQASPHDERSTPAGN